MKNIAFGLASALTLACATCFSVPAKELKVLMIGNSFSISNVRNMPQICADLGLELELGSLYIGGCSLERHWNNIVASTNADFKPYEYQLYRSGKRVAEAPTKANVPEIVKGTDWDVITLQQASHFSWQANSYDPFFDDICRKIKSWHPTAEIVVQETWSYTPFDKRLDVWKIDQNKMYSELHRAYGRMRARGFRVIPTGTAVQLWRERLPVKYTETSFGGDVCGSLRADGAFGDVFHLNRRGEYFQSLVWTAKLFGADVTKCRYVPNFVTASDAALMQQIATMAVNGEVPSSAFGGRREEPAKCLR